MRRLNLLLDRRDDLRSGRVGQRGELAEMFLSFLPARALGGRARENGPLLRCFDLD